MLITFDADSKKSNDSDNDKLVLLQSDHHSVDEHYDKALASLEASEEQKACLLLEEKGLPALQEQQEETCTDTPQEHGTPYKFFTFTKRSPNNFLLTSC